MPTEYEQKMAALGIDRGKLASGFKAQTQLDEIVGPGETASPEPSEERPLIVDERPPIVEEQPKCLICGANVFNGAKRHRACYNAQAKATCEEEAVCGAASGGAEG